MFTSRVGSGAWDHIWNCLVLQAFQNQNQLLSDSSRSLVCIGLNMTSQRHWTFHAPFHQPAENILTNSVGKEKIQKTTHLGQWYKHYSEWKGGSFLLNGAKKSDVHYSCPSSKKEKSPPSVFSATPVQKPPLLNETLWLIHPKQKRLHTPQVHCMNVQSLYTQSMLHWARKLQDMSGLFSYKGVHSHICLISTPALP